MGIFVQKFKIVVCCFILLSSFLLSGWFPVSDGKMTHISSPSSSAPNTRTRPLLRTPVGTLAPSWTMAPSRTPTPTKIATRTQILTPTPTVSLTPISFPDGYILFESDFEADSEDLILEAGWQIQTDENGNHFLCNFDQVKPSLQIVIGEPNWGNYQLEFVVKQIEFVKISEMLTLLVRDYGEAHYHFLVYFASIPNNPPSVPAGSGYISLGKKINLGEYLQLTGEYFGKPVENQWYRVRIVLYEGYISFYWDDELVLDYLDEDYLPAGAIRIYTDDGTCLDNIRVTNIQNP